MAKRQICLSLLLILLVSHVSVAAHVATHVPGELGECQLCLSYGNASPPLAECHESGVIPLGSDPVVSARSAVVIDVAVHQPRLRGPPLHSL